MTVDDFVHLHLHSDMSQLDGAGKISEYVQTAVARGHKAIAFTDHGTMRGVMTQYEKCKELDIKPIFGTEFYVARDMKRKGVTDEEKAELTKDAKKLDSRAIIKEYEEREGIRDRWHITVWAQNNVGLRNLYRLSSASWIDGFYYKPRIDLDALIAHGEGLIVASGCLSSPINDSHLNGKRRLAFEYADRLHEAFGERFWLEVQPHAIKEQVDANKFMLELRERYGGKNRLLATQDAHYVNPEDAEHHEVLLCIGTNANLSDPNRFKFDGDEFFFKTRKQMWKSFQRNHEFIPSQLLKEALNSTMELAESCSAKIEVDYHKALLPDPGVPAEFKGDHFVYLKALCKSGWTWRDMPRRIAAYAAREKISKAEAGKRYVDRLKMELGALKRQKFVPYFLIIHDLYKFARGESIMVGPGRGSVGGSLVAYLLGITATEPLEHGLIFERFISPFRIDMPDCDMDFEDRRRGEIVEYLRNKYGRERVCQIATFGKLSGKQCIRDVSRVLQVPLNEVNQVTSSIIERSSGDERASQTIEDSFKDFEVCREFDKRHPKVLHHAKRLEGMVKNLGIHAAGVIASPVPLTDVIPLEVRNSGGEKLVVSAFEMYGVAANGLVKLDVLGLRTLTVIKEALEAIEKRHGRKIDMESADDVNLNDPKVLAAFTAHDYGGVFQYDTPSADKVCQGVNFTSFEDVAAMTALNRPGTSRSGLATKYVERKKNPKLVEKIDFHPAVSKITADTLGIIVYQEHVIRIFTDIAGFAPGTADSLRKTIAKKIGDETLGKEREAFIAGALKHTPGMTKEVAGKIMDAITFFGCLPSATLLSTPLGSRPICDLKPGDRIWSFQDGAIVPNRVKAIGPSGRKRVVLIALRDHRGERRYQRASLGHWWLRTDGRYTKTSELTIGSRLSFATELNYVGGENKLRTRVSSEGSFARPVQSVLPEGVQGREDGRGQSGQLGTQQEERSASREGLEIGAGQVGPGGGGPGGGDQRGSESGVVRRPHSGFQEPGRGAQKEDREVPALRSAPGSDAPRAEHESASWASQGQGYDEQSSVEPGVDLPALPFQGAPSGEGSRWLEVEALILEEEVETWDLECEDAPANYVLANGLISHNSYGFNKSHATAYGLIAFWEMWLKVYYPVEFYWALLKNEPDRIKIQQLAKDAKKHEIELLPPHVSTSSTNFVIDGARTIRGSLVDIKGVGEKAAESIMANQPYADIHDFIARVERRKVNRGVVLALAKAGALDGLVTNLKAFVENIDVIWDAFTSKTKKKIGTARALLEQKSAEGGDYSADDKTLLASSVNPLAFGKHPIDAYATLLEGKLKCEIVEMGGEDYFKDYDGKGHFIAGIIVEVKYNQIGDFHTGALPSELERKRQFWGARYANVNIEDRSGKQNRVKFDIHLFDCFRPLIDKGIGTPVLAHVTASAFTSTLRAQFAVDLDAFRMKTQTHAPLDLWERIVCGQHPTRMYNWPDVATRRRRLRNEHFYKHKTGGAFVGVVTHVQLKYDKKGGLMALFGLIGGDLRYIEVMCFASVWATARRVIAAGRLIKIDIDRKPDARRGWQCFFNGGRVKWLKKGLVESASEKEIE